MPKIIQGKNKGSRIKRLEENVKVQRKGKKEKLGPPKWAKGNDDKGNGGLPDHAKRNG